MEDIKNDVWFQIDIINDIFIMLNQGVNQELNNLLKELLKHSTNLNFLTFTVSNSTLNYGKKINYLEKWD
jgi:hypothetical protein